MHDRELYRRILGIQLPWDVSDGGVELPGTGVTVYIRNSGAELNYPRFGAACSGCDIDERKWRHLDTCQYSTGLIGQVPRVGCPERGIHQRPSRCVKRCSRLTARSDPLVIDWLKIGMISEVAARLGLSWSVVNGVRPGASGGFFPRREGHRRKRRLSADTSM